MQNSDKANILKRSPIFSGLNDEELAELSRLAVERRFGANEFIFWDGDAPDWFYIIAEGKVKILKHASSGKDFVIAFFESGEMFGEVAVFEDRPYPASAQSITDTRVVGIKKESFLSFLVSRPQVSLSVIKILAERLRTAQSRLRDFAGERVEQRLASILLMLASKLGANLNFTRQELADMAGITIETTIRVMSQWRDRGIIRSTRGKITILDPEKLKILGEGPPLV